MTEFIEFCNNNQGFVSAILSFFAILISVIAIVVSIHAAHLPYRKKLWLGHKVLCNYNSKTNKLESGGYIIEVTNVGNVPISLEFFGWAYKDSTGKIKRIFNADDPKKNSTFLKIGQTVSIEYKKDMRKNSTGKNCFIVAMEPNGRTYKLTKRQLEKQARKKKYEQHPFGERVSAIHN